MTDFEINEDVLIGEDVDIIDEQMQEAIERNNIERERLLAMALHEGYDGVDIKMHTTVVTNYRDYSMGFEYEAWKDDPPTLDRFGQNVRRYDFRLLDKGERWQLLARIGVSYDE